MCVGQPQDPAQQENADRAGRHTCRDSQDNRIPMLFEQMQLLIKRDCQTYGCRGQKPAQIRCTLIICFIIHSYSKYTGNYKRGGNQQRIQDCQSGPFLQPAGKQIRPDAEDQAKILGLF